MNDGRLRAPEARHHGLAGTPAQGLGIVFRWRGSACMITRVRRGYCPVGHVAGTPGEISTCESHRTSGRKAGLLDPVAAGEPSQLGCVVCSTTRSGERVEPPVALLAL